MSRQSRQSRHRYEAICEASPDAIVLVDTEGRITYANGRVTDLFGYEPDELLGDPIEILVPESSSAMHVDKRNRYIDDPETRPMGANLDLFGRRKDGSLIPIDISLSPIESDSGLEVMAAVRDISKQYALRMKYQTILEAVPDAVVVADATTGEIVEINEQVTDLLGYETEELVGERQSVLHPTTEDDRYRRLFEQYITAEQSILTQFPDGSDIYVETKDGGRIPVEINAHVFELQERQLIAGVFREVTARKEYERQLHALHEATRRLMRADDREEIARLVADSAKTILGYSSNVVRLVNDEMHLHPVAVTDQAKADMGDRPDYPTNGENPVSRAYESGELHRYDDVREIEDGYDRGNVRSALYLPMGDHGVISIVDPKAGAFDRSDDELASILSLNAEIALNRLAYERSLERQNDRLDDFASILAHDLRNPLNVAYALLEDARAGHTVAELDEMETVLDRMTGIIDDVLTMVRGGYDVDAVEPLVLSTLVTECWETVATADATLRVDFDGVIYADSSRIRNVFENLFRNAIEHGGTDVSVSVGVVEDGFYVADDGPGIPEAERDRVLEPGWTTTEDGTGLGLNIVLEIAQAHGWDVSVSESEAGGARFDFTGVRTAVYDGSFDIET
ncbi:PAS domain-containing sensor histidine kinase [Natrinema halophilum]|uniref:histidine kinase n=1 Tax=Natrinema halophilum TaxID=1699371 RepID=A0A7D5GNL3_9EURY|nr:PAS domain S-box protein [Natrinema halophilum]QLG49473.1 PAS domain S-box protein [Natrinema halophilum]